MPKDGNSHEVSLNKSGDSDPSTLNVCRLSDAYYLRVVS